MGLGRGRGEGRKGEGKTKGERLATDGCNSGVSELGKHEENVG